ncbi:MAG: 20S proteasome subunit A/B [Gammaproteobacteria bacterium]|nr:20S proteasome subunit A/B [Gammaproteobacteria bacterium]
MTYCVGLSLDDGLVFASDSRTNAGVDYVTTYSKMHLFTPAPDRLFVVLSAGNLATTQEVINHIQRDIDYPTGGINLANVKYLFEAAEYIGKIIQQVQLDHSAAFAQSGVSGETTMLLGGQIAGKPHGLMMIYPQGNYIASSPQTPYLQIGESKYGKPALDRIAYPGMSLDEGARLTLVSLDATTRSNITVGPPFEIAIYPKDSLKLDCHCVFAESDPYLITVRDAWNTGINDVFDNLPVFEKHEEDSLLVAGAPAAVEQQQQQQTSMATPVPMPEQFR